MPQCLDYSITGEVESMTMSLLCDIVDECRSKQNYPVGVVYEFLKNIFGDEEHTLTSKGKEPVTIKPIDLLNMFESAIDMLKDEIPEPPK